MGAGMAKILVMSISTPGQLLKSRAVENEIGVQEIVGPLGSIKFHDVTETRTKTGRTEKRLPWIRVEMFKKGAKVQTMQALIAYTKLAEIRGRVAPEILENPSEIWIRATKGGEKASDIKIGRINNPLLVATIQALKKTRKA